MTSPYASTGNGFDFLIDPYRFGGNPASVTSVPYPVVAIEGFDARPEGTYDVSLIQNLESLDAVTPEAVSGTMRSILVAYTGGPDSINAIAPVAFSGLMDQILVRYTGGPDSIDPVTPVATNGALRDVLIEIEMPTDSFNSVVAVATGGTLT